MMEMTAMTGSPTVTVDVKMMIGTMTTKEQVFGL